jgi:hypothetical protein
MTLLDQHEEKQMNLQSPGGEALFLEWWVERKGKERKNREGWAGVWRPGTQGSTNISSLKSRLPQFTKRFPLHPP